MGFIKNILNTKVGRTVTGAVGGVLGFTGGNIAGLELEWALIFAGTLIVFIVVGPEKAKQFKTLWMKDKDD